MTKEEAYKKYYELNLLIAQAQQQLQQVIQIINQSDEKPKDKEETPKIEKKT